MYLEEYMASLPYCKLKINWTKGQKIGKLTMEKPIEFTCSASNIPNYSKNIVLSVLHEKSPKILGQSSPHWKPPARKILELL